MKSRSGENGKPEGNLCTSGAACLFSLFKQTLAERYRRNAHRIGFTSEHTHSRCDGKRRGLPRAEDRACLREQVGVVRQAHTHDDRVRIDRADSVDKRLLRWIKHRVAAGYDYIAAFGSLRSARGDLLGCGRRVDEYISAAKAPCGLCSESPVPLVRSGWKGARR